MVKKIMRNTFRLKKPVNNNKNNQKQTPQFLCNSDQESLPTTKNCFVVRKM